MWETNKWLRGHAPTACPQNHVTSPASYMLLYETPLSKKKKAPQFKV